MKKKHIFGVAIFSDGTQKISRDFVSPEAFSKWVNAQFKKDEGVTVEEYHDYAVGEFRKVCIWHA